MQERYIFPLLLASILGFAPGFASAATIPSSAEPSRARTQLPATAPAPVPEGVVRSEPVPAVAAPPGAERIKFALKAVVIDGMTVFTAAAVSPLYADMIGKEVSLADIYALAEKLSVKYRNDGYILSQVVVPPQIIDNGLVALRAVEGFVDQVIIQSDDGDYLAPYAAAIKASRPLNQKLLEKYMLLLNDLPGVSAQSVLSPSPTTPGAADLTLTVERKAYDISLGGDNRGTRYMGPLQVSAGARLNGFFGRHDSLSLQLASAPDGQPTREMDFASLGATHPLDHEGTMLTVSGSVTPTAPGYLLKPLEVRGMVHAYHAEIMHPFLRARSENLHAALKFDYLDTTRVDNLGLDRIEDRLRVLRLAAAYQLADRFEGNNTLTAEISRGLDVLGARPKGSPNMTRAAGDPEFFKITAEAVRVQRLAEHLDISVGATGQWAANPLLASEEFGVGGSAYGSAYDSSEITGRNGLAGRVELRDNNPVVTRLQALQLYGFYDIGKVWDPENASARDRIRSLASAGLGLRVMLSAAFSGAAELALPLTRKVETENNKDPRLFFALAAKF